MNGIKEELASHFNSQEKSGISKRFFTAVRVYASKAS